MSKEKKQAYLEKCKTIRAIKADSEVCKKEKKVSMCSICKNNTSCDILKRHIESLAELNELGKDLSQQDKNNLMSIAIQSSYDKDLIKRTVKGIREASDNKLAMFLSCILEINDMDSILSNFFGNAD